MEHEEQVEQARKLLAYFNRAQLRWRTTFIATR